MALIKCPECAHDVSTKAKTCPNCGYELSSYVRDIEIKRLYEQILPVDFIVPEGCRAKVCLKCGCHSAANYDPNCDCGFPLVEVDYPVQKCLYPGGDLYILQHDIIPRHIGDTDSDEYKARIQKLNQDIERLEQKRKAEGRADWKIIPEPPDKEYLNSPANPQKNSFRASVQQSVPRCPICSSVNLTKISTMKKAAKISVFGLFGAGDIGKTWKCNSCGSKF